MVSATPVFLGPRNSTPATAQVLQPPEVRHAEFPFGLLLPLVDDFVVRLDHVFGLPTRGAWLRARGGPGTRLATLGGATRVAGRLLVLRVERLSRFREDA